MIKRIILVSSILIVVLSIQSFDYNVNTNSKFKQIVSKAKKEHWHSFEFGELIGKIGMEFLGIPYVAYTLEHVPEQCIINLNGLDCVTFFENSLNMARIFKKQIYSYDSLKNFLTYTRYRNGKLTDYTSRLHYTAEWIADNIKKGVVKDITKELGGIPIKFNVNFMSKNPDKYKALSEHPEFIPVIAKIEEKINNMSFYYIPKNNISSIENQLKTGDIIAFVTNIPGLDYSHTGLIYVDNKGVARLLHASSKQKKVVLDKRLSDYIKPIKNDIGVTILRATGK